MRHFYSILQKGIARVMVIAFIFSLSSCAKKIYFSNSSVEPAAQGSVKMTKDRNENYSLNINIMNLAPPERMQPASSVYLVWMDTEGNGTKNLGKIMSGGNMLSKTLKGSLNSVTRFKPTRVYITAETDPGVTTPGNLVVMTTQNF
jgi:hypothetical protein